MKCKDCNQEDRFTHSEGKFQICECGGATEEPTIKRTMRDEDIENISNNLGKKGRLRFVTKAKTLKLCDTCNEPCNPGQPCWDQSNYQKSDFFPVKDRLCFNCGLKERESGTEIKNKELYDKWIHSQGCGVDMGLMKCGELNLEKKPMAYCLECTEKYKLKGVFNGE